MNPRMIQLLQSLGAGRGGFNPGAMQTSPGTGGFQARAGIGLGGSNPFMAQGGFGGAAQSPLLARLGQMFGRGGGGQRAGASTASAGSVAPVPAAPRVGSRTRMPVRRPTVNTSSPSRGGFGVSQSTSVPRGRARSGGIPTSPAVSSGAPLGFQGVFGGKR